MIGFSPAEVEIYDSGFPILSGLLQQQIAALLCTKHDAITVRCITLHALSHTHHLFNLDMIFLHLYMHLHPQAV